MSLFQDPSGSLVPNANIKLSYTMLFNGGRQRWKMRLVSHLVAKYWFGIRVVIMCILWYSCSSGQSIINKLTLQKYPYPLTIALSSLLNNVIYAFPLIKILHIQPVKITTPYLMKTIVPISLGRAIAVASAYFGLYKVPVSYAQTVKATMPVFTVLISRILLNERQSKRVYISLLPIIIGVFTASVTELQFDSMGLALSLLSTFIFAYLNVLAKKVFEETGMHPILLLSINSQLASVVLFPVWTLKDGISMWNSISYDKATRDTNGLVQPDFQFLIYLFVSGVCSFLQNLCAFALIHQLTTLSYSVSNAAKRIFVIILSLITLRNPVTPINIFGMMISVLGVFMYNRMKSSEKPRLNKCGLITPLQNGKTSEGSSLLRRKSSFEITNLHSTGSDVNLMLSTSG